MFLIVTSKQVCTTQKNIFCCLSSWQQNNRREEGLRREGEIFHISAHETQTVTAHAKTLFVVFFMDKVFPQIQDEGWALIV